MTTYETPKGTVTVMSHKTYMRNKYGNKKTIVDGIKFDSKKEAEYYGQLKIRLLAKEILSFERQISYPIEINGVNVCKYIADFVIVELIGLKTVVDCKGFATPEYKLKKKLMLAVHGIEIKEV